MSETIDLQNRASVMLAATSRTFAIPISFLPPGLREAVTSAYLCMRAVDEIEDHEELPSEDKVHLLRTMSSILERPFRYFPQSENDLTAVLDPYKSLLPEVTIGLSDWIKLSPPSAAPFVCGSTAEMSAGMAIWTGKKWRIKNEEDLDQYTYYVAGLVGLLLSNLWMWHDTDIKTDRDLAVAFGRGLQAVNILRNRSEDLYRGVDYFPDGWELEDMFRYARRNLALADIYWQDIEAGPIRDFCRIPLALAHGTLDALEAGESKLSRASVAELVNRVTNRG